MESEDLPYLPEPSLPEHPSGAESGLGSNPEPGPLEAPAASGSAPEPEAGSGPGQPAPPSGLARVFLGASGLRAGWSILLFLTLLFVASIGFGWLAQAIRPLRGTAAGGLRPEGMIVSELVPFLGLLVAAGLVARIEGRSVLDFNLRDPRPARRFAGGLLCGLLALSTLVGLLAMGGWLTFGPSSPPGAAILRLGALWAAGFLLVAGLEEGVFRCYLLSTLTRGINLWWSLGLVGLMCLWLLLHGGSAAWGVYVMALAGVVPCLLLHLRRREGAGFWQAAWVTSTLFGFVHISNRGENWIGILGAALIGLVLCASVRLTGSAWLAIGIHAGWDWSETFFYGTADSGLAAQGHLLSTAPSGSPLWSGGTDGPEGSLLVLPVCLLLLAALWLVYGRSGAARAAAPQAHPLPE